MLLDPSLHILEVARIKRLQFHHLLVHILAKRARGIPDIRDAAAHARREVAARLAEDHCPATGHVFAAVVARALDDGLGATVPHAEPLAADAADVDLAAGGSVAHDVAGNHVLLRLEAGIASGPHDHAAAREPLAAVIVDVALDLHGHAGHAKRHDALPGRAGEGDLDRAVGEAGRTVPTGHLAGEDRAGRAVDVADRQIELHGLAGFQGRLAEVEQRRHVERLLDPVILRRFVVRLHVLRHHGLVQDRGEVEALCLPVGDRGPRVEPVHPAHHLVDRAESKLGHQLTDLLGQHEEEVDDVLRLTGEPLAQLRILRGDPHRTGVEMALPHHDAADHDERRRGNAEFLGAEHGGDHHVLGRADHAVGLHDDPPAEVVHHEHLVRLGEAELPRQPAVHDRGLRARTGATVVAGNEHHVGLPLRHARGDRAHAHLRHQLHADPRVVVGVLEVVDQLREILDRVDVVVGRRRNQAHSRRAVANPRDLAVDLVAGKLAPLARLRALRHLDLQLLRVDEIEARHAEAAAGHLLDRGVLAVTRRLQLIPHRVFAPLAGVAAAAEPVHRDGERLVGLLRDRSIRHRAGGEPLHDLLGRLHLVERNRSLSPRRRIGPVEVEQATEREQLRLLLVDQLLILLELGAAVDLGGPLERRHDVGREHVRLPLPPPLIAAADVEFERLGHAGLGPGMLVTIGALLGHALEADAADPARRPREEFIDEPLLETDRLEDLRAAVALLRGDAHLAHHLQQALGGRFDEVLVELLTWILGRDHPLRLHLVDRGKGEVGIDGAGAVAREQGEVLHLAGLACLDDDAAPRPRSLPHQMVVHAAGREQHRHGGLFPADAAVGEHDDRRAACNGPGGFVADRVEPLSHPGRAFRSRKEQRDGFRDDSRLIEGLDPRTFGVGDHGRFQPQETTLLGLRVEQVPLAADRRDHRRDDLLANGVERRVRHLREELLKVIGEQLRPVGEHGQRRVVAHRTDWLSTVGGHRSDDHLQILERVAVGPLQFEQARRLARNPRRPPGVDGMGRGVAIRSS